ncbi:MULTISPECIES: cohesin domain-containing protein [unclassified Ruminococcus]|uniref:cohesin domain-containing protein n=1 Tax=unclassified Ruminococcus TaxID=2608920 RepID=UPI00210C0879|nr:MULTISPECIES: cohesin domain-containing protein [unclassified Ruminococcus]MCQ4021932.1 hypothetical protein [Ruminococcus sp. zg-924]MCQ4115668.1 hypothetical protein [Ruminococcus sp. zg-921]
MKKKFIKVISLTVVLAIILVGAVVQISAADTSTMSLDNASGYAGDNVKITLTCSNNPGINGWAVYISYDSSALELVSVDDDSTFGAITTRYGNPIRVQWYGLDDVTVNGKMAGILFKIKDNATPGDYPITVTYDKDEVVNQKEQNVEFAVNNGIVTVKENKVDNHDLKKVDAQKATCTKEGNIEYYVCDGCGKWFSDATGTFEIADHNSVIIKKTAHTPSEWIEDKAATETDKGSQHKECTVCGEVLETKEIPVIEPTKPTGDDSTDPSGDEDTKPTAKPTTQGPTKVSTDNNNATLPNGKTPSAVSGTVKTGQNVIVFTILGVMLLSVVSVYVIGSLKKRKRNN